MKFHVCVLFYFFLSYTTSIVLYSLIFGLMWHNDEGVRFRWLWVLFSLFVRGTNVWLAYLFLTRTFHFVPFFEWLHFNHRINLLRFFFFPWRAIKIPDTWSSGVMLSSSFFILCFLFDILELLLFSINWSFARSQVLKYLRMFVGYYASLTVAYKNFTE